MRTLPWFTLSFLTIACQGAPVSSPPSVPAAVAGSTEAKLRRLSQLRIYFGHQSVGYDLMGGLQVIAQEHPSAGLRIEEASPPTALPAPAFVHGRNGANQDPLSKIRGFARTLEQEGLGETVDVALFKFCYVDFPPGTDEAPIFAEYQATMARLRRAFPSVRFVHVTVPLAVVQSGPKAWLKRLLGRPVGGAEANLARERFNALMRQAYGGREPLYDLAAIEASRRDGRTETFRSGGQDHLALAPEHASDGKHLNAAGARWAASHLLDTLANAAE